MTEEVNLVDSATTCAHELKYLLDEENLTSDAPASTATFFVTDMASKFSENGAKFLGKSLIAIKVVGKE